MTFRDWQQLTPEQAAHEVHARVANALPPAQRRAVVAWLCPLFVAFAAYAWYGTIREIVRSIARRRFARR